MLVMGHWDWMIWCRGKGWSERARKGGTCSSLLLFYAFDYTLLEKSTLSGPFFDNG